MYMRKWMDLMNESKNAIYNRTYADPRDILEKIRYSLNNKTGYEFKTKKISISDEKYYAIYKANNVYIQVVVSWNRDGSIRKPVVKGNIKTAKIKEESLFHYRVELDDEIVNGLWDNESEYRISDLINN